MNAKTRIRMGTAAISLLVAAVAFACFSAIRELTRANDLVAHTNRVLDEIDAIPSYTKDVISGARGYVITGNRIYLQVYNDAGSQIGSHLNSLFDLTADSPVQRKHAAELRALVQDELDIQAKIIQARAAGGKQLQQAAFLESGKQTMDRIRSLSAEMKLEENRVLTDNMDAADLRTRQLEITIFALCLLAVLMVGGTYAIWVHDGRLHEQASQELRESEEKIRLLLNSAAEAIYSIDLQGKCTSCNPACLHMLGYQDEQQLLGHDIHKLVHHTMANGMPLPGRECRILRALPLERGVHSDDEVFWRADGSSFPVEYWSYPMRRDGKITGAVITFFDITRRKQTDDALVEANQRLEASVRDLERAGDEISRLKEMGSLLQSCLTLEEAYQVVERSVRGLFPQESGGVFVIASSRDIVEAQAVWGPGLSGENVFSRDDCWALRSGQPHRVEGGQSGLVCRHVSYSDGMSYLCLPMVAQGEALGVLHLQFHAPAGSEMALDGDHFLGHREGLASTVAEQIALALANLRLRDALRAQSIRDPLTGLFNRRFMEESLDRELKRSARSGRPVGVILLDVDHFKRYNDTYGHEAGDAVLRELGNFIRALVRGEDVACRYGGEEFILLMPEATVEIAAARAEQLRQGVKRIQVSAHGQPLGAISISIGVAAYPVHGVLSDVLLRSADNALYEAKSLGRDRVVISTAIPETTA